MYKQGFAVSVGQDVVPSVAGRISNMLQKRVEDAVNYRPLTEGETRGIEGMPNHLIGAMGRHNYRDHVASTTVGRQVIFIHEVPQS